MGRFEGLLQWRTSYGYTRTTQPQRTHTGVFFIALHVGVTQPILSVPLFSHFIYFSLNNQSTYWLLSITVAFYRYHRSLAAVTTTKYERVSKDITNALKKKKKISQK